MVGRVAALMCFTSEANWNAFKAELYLEWQ